MQIRNNVIDNKFEYLNNYLDYLYYGYMLMSMCDMDGVVRTADMSCSASINCRI